MKIIDRIVFFIYTLIMAVFSIGVMVVSLRLVPLELVWEKLVMLLSERNLELGVTALIIFLISARFLWSVIFSKQEKESIIQGNDLGDVRISLTAIENLIMKIADGANGISDIKVSIYPIKGKNKKGLAAKIKAATGLETNIPSTALEIQEKVYENVKNTVGIELVEIKVNIETISNNLKAKHKVR